MLHTALEDLLVRWLEFRKSKDGSRLTQTPCKANKLLVAIVGLALQAGDLPAYANYNDIYNDPSKPNPGDSQIVTEVEIKSVLGSITPINVAKPCPVHKGVEGEYYLDNAVSFSQEYIEALGLLRDDAIKKLAERKTTRRELNAAAVSLTRLISKSAKCTRIGDLPPDMLGVGGGGVVKKTAIVNAFTEASLKAALHAICPLFPFCD